MFGKLFSNFATGGLLEAGKGIIGLVTSYKEKKITKEIFLAQLETEIPRLQIQVNLAEAQHPSMFVSGWRPFVGWTCGAGLAYQYLFAPIANGLLVNFGQSIAFASLDLATLMPLLLGMLGLATVRTVEKVRGKARS